ncbi:MAG: hypothetical protein AVO38_16260, partial [delta proteobacterium ML8_D]
MKKIIIFSVILAFFSIAYLNAQPMPPVLIFPSNGAPDIPPENLTLQWQLQDGQYHVDSFFDVYCDIDPDFPNPPLYSGPLPPSRTFFEYHIAALLAEQPYYWFVRYSDFVDNYILDSPVFTFLTGPTAIPYSMISGTISSSHNVSAVTVTCPQASVPNSVSTGLAGTFSFTVNNGLNPVVTPTKQGYWFSPSYHQFNNIQANQTANFFMYSWLSNPPFQPIPVEFAGDVSINIGQLKWSYLLEPYYTEPTGFEVYFPATAPDPYDVVPYTGREQEYSVDIPVLEYSTTYDWKVVPYNDHGEAEGVEVWSFTTEDPPPGPPVLLYPPDGETGLPAEEITLQFDYALWQPDSFFDIFVDMDPDFPEEPVYSGPLTPVAGTMLSYNIGPLMAEQLFHWKVRVTQGVEEWTSAIRNFSTGTYIVPTHYVSGTLYNQSGIATTNRKITFYANNVYMGYVNSSP